ncbi:unnamed protein product [Nezara viridula]|uniref:Uncharacterized protein n=1 Tax=Nezara viridula TaxID=85310 RepID=A0A9P0EIX5_NEZVI|nr:unnamed protein product [Nezara viridula]
MLIYRRASSAIVQTVLCLPQWHNGFTPPRSNMVLYILLVSLCLCVFVLRAIDPQERVGTCVKININVTYYMNANEGVWFPQYRARDDDYVTDIYSCHTIYEKVYLDDDGKPWLETSSYYSKNDKIVKDGHVQVFYKSDERGKMNSSTYIPEEGNYQIYNYVLNLTPEYRVRYVCSDFPRTIPGVHAVYIETRKLYPTIKTIMKARDVLEKYKLAVPLVKINQKKCTRPINMDGYVPLSTKTGSS